MISMVECPRDAIQGWSRPVPAAEKIAYYTQLLQVGFDTIDIGSFVSPKAIPQMADTAEVLAAVADIPTKSKLLVIVANSRGTGQALTQAGVHYLGFPFSLSPTFQQRNTNSTQAESYRLIGEIQEGCRQAGKELVVYLSMGFGNPYGDAYSAAQIGEWAENFSAIGVKNISLADTVGLAEPKQIGEAVGYMKTQHPDITTSVHLHCTPDNWQHKLEAALAAGCDRVDAAIGGIGGCPMAQDSLVGNLATENVIAWCLEKGWPLQPIDMDAYRKARQMANTLFQNH